MNPRSGRAPGSTRPASRRWLGLILGAALLAAVVVAGILWKDARGAEGTSSPPPPGESSTIPDGRVTVPDVLGLTEGPAVRALGDAGLVAELRYDETAPPGGGVVAVDPEPGARVGEESIVLVHVSFPESGTTRPRPEPCERSLDSLDAVQAALSKRDWTSRAVSFTSFVDPDTCTVRIESDLLTAAEMESIVARYGTSVSFNASPRSRPVRMANPER
jgi:hypothetical protein